MRTGEEGTAYLLPRARVPRHAWRAQAGRLRDRRARDDPQLSIHSPRSHAVGPRHAWQCHLVKRARANGRGPCRLNAGPTWGARSAAARGSVGAVKRIWEKFYLNPPFILCHFIPNYKIVYFTL